MFFIHLYHYLDDHFAKLIYPYLVWKFDKTLYTLYPADFIFERFNVLKDLGDIYIYIYKYKSIYPPNTNRSLNCQNDLDNHPMYSTPWVLFSMPYPSTRVYPHQLEMETMPPNNCVPLFLNLQMKPSICGGPMLCGYIVSGIL
jgi:hypothetical protein